MFYKEPPRFNCPVCTERLPPAKPARDRRLRCPVCGAELIFDFKYFWGYRLICALASIFIAQSQKLEGPIFVAAALIYFMVFFIVGARYLLPLFPFYIRIFTPPFITLGINNKRRPGQ